MSMRVAGFARATLLACTAATARPVLGFTSVHTLASWRHSTCWSSPLLHSSSSSSSRSSIGRFMTTSTSQTEMPSLRHIGREEMEEILDQVDDDSNTNYVVIDVRGIDEIAMTGPLSPAVKTLPLPIIMQQKVFEMDDDEFEEVCRFPKPEPDAILVFSCAAGVRSVYAANFAAQAGFTNLVNYVGGANEWFSPY